MDQFIKYEEWEGHWCFKPAKAIDLLLLKQLDFDAWSQKKKEINISIDSSATALEPSIGQQESLPFMLENQAEILQTIFNFHQRFIYPIYKEAIDIEEEEIVNDLSQLSRVYGIERIEIPQQKKSNAVYFLIKFDFCYDDEHGLYFVFEDTSIIAFFGEGDKDLDAISLYQDGLSNKDGTALTFNLYGATGTKIFNGECYFDEVIAHPIKKGAYRMLVNCNERGYCINFYTPHDLEKFSLKETLSMK